MTGSIWTGRRWAVETDAILPTRKEFLLAMAAAAAVAQPLTAQEPPPHANGSKLLIVVAHPDDEYAFAAATYRLVRELGWTADQVVITNGEAGYRYSSLASAVYGVALSTEQDGRARLPAIRKEEVVRAGKILGIRRHYFLDQKDLGFTRDAASADSGNWDRGRVLSFLGELLARERYDVVFTLLPTAQTHGHHRAATLLALQAVSALPAEQRPLIFGADPRAKSDAAPRFTGLPRQPLSATVSADPILSFDRTAHFGYANALDYQVVVNWVIAEHKSQGLFQMDAGRHDLEQFWLFEASGKGAFERAHALEEELRVNRRSAAVR